MGTLSEARVTMLCLLTGATGAIGRAIAVDLAGTGVTVIGTYHSDEAGALELGRRLREMQAGSDVRRCSVTDTSEVRSLVRRIVDEHGAIDLLVNNAGIWRGGRFTSLAEEDWKAVLRTDLEGVFTMTQAVLPSMLTSGAGRIVNVASAIGLMGYPGDCAYSAAKAGVIAFTKSLAKEVVARGISVNAVAPGSIEGGVTNLLDGTARERLLARIPARRVGHPQEVAEVVRFLASAPAYMSGAVLTLDGSLT